MTDLIPPLYAEAQTDLSEVEHWCNAVQAGQAARLLLLGPTLSGKTHTAYAALGRLLRASYPVAQIAALNAHDLGEGYGRQTIEAGPLVIFLDDLTNKVDNMVGVKDAAVGDPFEQSALAAADGAAIDAAARLAARTYGSWIACASGVEQLGECLGEDVSAALMAAAVVVSLPMRPLPDFRF